VPRHPRAYFFFFEEPQFNRGVTGRAKTGQPVPPFEPRPADRLTLRVNALIFIECFRNYDITCGKSRPTGRTVSSAARPIASVRLNTYAELHSTNCHASGPTVLTIVKKAGSNRPESGEPGIGPVRPLELRPGWTGLTGADPVETG